MLVSYHWLQEFLDLNEAPTRLAEKITRTGIEIASTVQPMAGLKKLVAGHVLTCQKHPDSDHLHVTTVDVGEDKPLQIVCGAPNVAKGEDVIVALHGARIANNEKIKRGKIRGVVSDGMICGLQEIGFSDHVVPKKFLNGIFVFPKAIKPGTSVYHALGMDDNILDFDITPNRADTSSMEGAAYEVGAIIDQTPKIEPFSLEDDGNTWTDGWQTAVSEKLAPKYLLRRINQVKVADSPLWLQTRLWNAGIRPINNVVDATNYIMLLTGQPLHAYDARTFSDQKVEVHKGKPNEKLKLLDETEIEVAPEDIVISNGDHAVALAGVMGGYDSEVTENTTDVILESAVFDAALVRKAALRHANRTMASARFEKGINWDNTNRALDMAALMLKNHAMGQVAQGVLKVTDTTKAPVVITTSIAYINKIIGSQLSKAEIVKIFDRLCFKTETNKDEIKVYVPNRRWDIFIPADLIEEVARIYGYDNIKSTQPLLAETHGGYSPIEIKLRHVRNLLEQLGLDETINYSLTSLKKSQVFVKSPTASVTVQWPMNSSRIALRQNLLSGLIDTASYNLARKNSELRLFEQGRIFNKIHGEYHEYEHLAALYAGHTLNANWQHINQEVDFYYVKGQVAALFEALGIQDKVAYESDLISGMHPTRTACISIDGTYVGFVGMISPLYNVQDKALHGVDMYGFELDLEQIMPFMSAGVQSKAAPKFPAIQRDLSFVVADGTTHAQLIKAIREHGGKYLRDIDVIDFYEGAQIESGKKSLAYELTFLNEKETLTDQVVEKGMANITTGLEQEFGAIIR